MHENIMRKQYCLNTEKIHIESQEKIDEFIFVHDNGYFLSFSFTTIVCSVVDCSFIVLYSARRNGRNREFLQMTVANWQIDVSMSVSHQDDKVNSPVDPVSVNNTHIRNEQSE